MASLISWGRERVLLEECTTTKIHEASRETLESSVKDRHRPLSGPDVPEACET